MSSNPTSALTSSPNPEEVKNFLLELQSSICQSIEQEDGEADFIKDEWERPENEASLSSGGGLTRVLSNGKIFEQAGVNFSHVSGASLPHSATAKRPELAGRSFTAMGVSLVIHPHSPMIPTTHANVRFFIAEKEGEEPIWWFGGGFDLTPYYPFEEDVVHWHQTAKNACDTLDSSYYDKFKKWCDDYFYLPHRNETRGVGGLFFDDFNARDFSHGLALIKSVGNSFIPAYLPIVKKRKNLGFTPKQRDFQLYRRGRYVEFNLVYDRGTLFGLQTGGRTESILMSLPPLVRWEYNWSPEDDSEEEKLYSRYLKPQNWLG